VLADTPREVLELAGLRQENVNEIREVYQKRGIFRASRLISRNLLDEIAVHGDSRRILEEFEALSESGIDEFVFGPPYGVRPEEAVNELAEFWRGSS
jgi:hypothetical protein